MTILHGHNVACTPETKADLVLPPSLSRNLRLLPWMKFAQNLLFWQATWFLYLQESLSAAEAVLLYAVYDVGTTVFEVPSGYMSDRIGRRVTLIFSAIFGAAAMTLMATSTGFWGFAAAQILLGASIAFASGTDSALLYETLNAAGREDEIEAYELRLWRFSFTALMVSAVTGGVLAWSVPTLPFAGSALAFAAMFGMALFLRDGPGASERVQQASIGPAVFHALQNPILLWLFGLSVVMYGFSHVPFVFGQPFILEALSQVGLSGDAPLVSGLVTTVMMAISVTASFAAPLIRDKFGLAKTLLLAFAIQILLCAVLSLSQSMIAIAILFLRMVPDSLSRPFILARSQPLLSDGMRATYLSIQSFSGRILFAVSLWLASRNVSDVGEMPFDDLANVMAVYAIVGVMIWGVLFTTSRMARLG